MLQRFFFLLRPLLPWRLRVSVRRARALRKLRNSSHTWPIDPRAAAVPSSWPGWPAGKQFAFVLTHDVEGRIGAARIRQLMTIEKNYDVRSSFNLVPAGDYPISPELCAHLRSEGFEVGVHGYRHDGCLYRSRRAFEANATRVRHYLQEWGAVGFRSPFMQHELGWLHKLGIQYDSSTFDTDPFEPQPDGARTIFPFWVKGPNNTGFVELPYTLVQDFTLFIILRETMITRWKEKVDWIAQRGGMILVNTHPDYMSFGGVLPRQGEYPAALYADLLAYVRDKYSGKYWHALPHQVASYYQSAVACENRNSRRKVCMIAYTHYERDNRVRRYAETLARRGDLVDVISLADGVGGGSIAVLNGVTVHRIQRRSFEERNKWSYVFRLLRFLLRSSSAVTRLHARERYDVIHIHNMPDFLVFAAWYPKATGAKLILDVHDVVPELFEAKFRSRFRLAYSWLLRMIEKLSAHFCDYVIVSNHLWYNLLLHRSISFSRSTVLVNHVDPSVFRPRRRTRTDDRYIVIFPGTFQRHQGLAVAVDAFRLFKEHVRNAAFHLYGGGNRLVETELRAKVLDLGLGDSVKFCGTQSLDEIAQTIANADLGVVPKLANSFGNEAYSTKIMEFMSQGVPVVASRTKIDSFYFNQDTVRFFEPGDSADMCRAMLEVATNDRLRESLVARGYEYVRRHNWDVAKHTYLNLIDSLSTEDFGESTTPSKVATALNLE
jgi:glycosyltransferase involved in cell wall biosynthesis/peptidoglycan/xylan/chitin deacetylase (PgdA/CDA1 family)